jgi:hypothetical protein
MSLMDVLLPQHVEITQPARLIRFGEKDRDLSVEERVITLKINEIDKKLVELRNRNTDMKSRLNKMLRSGKDLSLVNKMRKEKNEVLRQIGLLSKRRISLQSKI